MGAFVFGTPSTAAAAGAATVLPTFTGTAQPVTSNSGSLTTAESTVVSTSSSISPLPTPSSYGSGSVVISPSVGRSKLHGTATNEPTTQYVNYTFPTPTSLPSSLLVPGYNAELTTDFPLAEDTGSIVSNNSLVGLLESLKNAPHLSRDGGKGGYLNGQHIFVFCDTYETSNATAQAEFLGFVSSSVAVDIGMSGLLSEPLTLQDGIGEWGDDVGRLRGFVPLTTGEEAYNKAMSGNGYRYAIWPDSSIIPLDQSRALLYAPLVYDSVNMSTQAANFTYFGNTLLTITVDEWGPAAQRTVNMMFGADDVEWGSAGGIRSWGPSGVGGMDGFVYVLGKVNDGLLLARTTPDAVANQSAVSSLQRRRLDAEVRVSLTAIPQYTYWDGSDWTAYMLSNTSTAIFINETFMDVDIFYSPYHLTFIMVYLSGDCDNTFYYRYLLSPTAIYPPYGRLGASNTSSTNYDYVESIVHYPWSDAQVLYKAEKPAGGIFIYAGSVHAGYYGQEDITLGGTKILLSWTANTGEAASSADSGYALITAEVDLAS